MPYIVLLPIFAGDILHGDARTFGFLAGASGVGALSGSLYLASRSTVVGLGRWIAGTAGTFGLALIAFSFSRNLYLSMVILCVAGFSIVVQLASSNTILQTIVDDQKRGRVMSLYTVAFLGMAPLGQPDGRQPGLPHRNACDGVVGRRRAACSEQSCSPDSFRRSGRSCDRSTRRWASCPPPPPAFRS